MSFTDLEDVEIQQESTRRALISSRPFWLTMSRVLQLLLAFTNLILTGYAVSIFGGDFFHTFGISFLAFVWTVVFMLYIFITPERAPKLYFYRVHIILEIITTAFWIVTLALLAWECQTWDAAEDVVNDSLTEAEAALVNSLPNQWSGVTAFRVALAFATMETILFSTTMFIIRRLLIQSSAE
ncbi:uncharacterized protein LY89DRAFT_667722 [Mollisia scopiformis]|uniref:MARVEL domain-containing protein n=1 Tax=Mollisia scopiformis TaxID=149040 RepID=A0A194XEM9_MOLSC|nr:uncharacterized protein LY89DRAFT_667722 [Mollisia scopiformis]KUJ18645.1 hypothetical protein LY89DRAFT_667722 [Mollisia scopiformis]